MRTTAGRRAAARGRRRRRGARGRARRSAPHGPRPAAFAPDPARRRPPPTRRPPQRPDRRRRQLAPGVERRVRRPSGHRAGPLALGLRHRRRRLGQRRARDLHRLDAQRPAHRQGHPRDRRPPRGLRVHERAAVDPDRPSVTATAPTRPGSGCRRAQGCGRRSGSTASARTAGPTAARSTSWSRSTPSRGPSAAGCTCRVRTPGPGLGRTGRCVGPRRGLPRLRRRLGPADPSRSASTATSTPGYARTGCRRRPLGARPRRLPAAQRRRRRPLAGQPRRDDPFPSRLTVDWVRVWDQTGPDRGRARRRRR